jgi:hypothetical protein
VRGCKIEFFLLSLILTFSRRKKEPIRERYNKKLASALKLYQSPPGRLYREIHFLHDKDEGSILPRNPAALLSRSTRHNLSDIAFVEVFDERVVVGVAMPFVLCRRG